MDGAIQFELYKTIYCICRNFLAYNEYYDEVLAVNVVCQTELWSILTLLGRIRCLSFDIIEVLCRTMKNPPVDRTSSLLKELDVVSDSFHNCISDSMFLQCLISKPQYSKVFLNYIKENVSSFSVKTLKVSFFSIYLWNSVRNVSFNLIRDCQTLWIQVGQ